MTITNRAYVILSAVLYFSLFPWAAVKDIKPDNGLNFQILPNKSVYSLGERMRVKFIITNTGQSPLYFFRGVSSCSSPLGLYYLLILDGKDQVMNKSGCSSELLIDQMDVVNTLRDSQLAILIGTGEIYGREEEFELPRIEGAYRLKAELIPPVFVQRQREILVEQHMLVIDRATSAPIVTIRVHRLSADGRVGQP